MVREMQRRLALLAIVAIVAVAWAAAFNGTGVTPVASAAAATPKLTVARVAATRCPIPTALRHAFEVAAADASIPPAMLWAVAKVESNLHPDAESAAGARGLLQVMPATATALDLNVDEPSSNVLAGARYLRQMLDRFHSSDLALAAYNAGPTAVTIAGGAPSIDVQRYVSNVNQLWHSVAGCR
jgi:soluble lytic murein transglycosylase-like protein